MKGYLTNLASRVVERPLDVRPRAASLFEPIGGPSIVVAEPPKKALRPRFASPPASERRPAEAHSERANHNSPIAALAVSPAASAEPPRQAKTTDRISDVEVSKISPPDSVHQVTVHRAVTKNEEKIEAQIGSVDRAPVRRDEAAPSFAPPLTNAPERTVLSESDITIIEMPETDDASVDDSNLVSQVGARVIVRPEVKPSHDAPSATGGPEIVHEVAPAIRITIGRVDVRAIMPQAQPPTGSSLQHLERKSPLTLDDYLKKRNGASR